MRLDDWFAIHTDPDQRIGAIDFNFGRIDTLEYGIFYAELLFAQDDFTAVIAELEKVIPKPGKLSAILRAREGEMWTAPERLFLPERTLRQPGSPDKNKQTSRAEREGRSFPMHCLSKILDLPIPDDMEGKVIQEAI